MATPAIGIYHLHTASTLACGDAVLSVKTSYINDEANAPYYQVLEQKLTWENTKTNQQRTLKTDGEYVDRRVSEQIARDGTLIPLSEKHQVLDAAFGSWTCLKPDQGKYYCYLPYYCTSSDNNKFCNSGKKFERIINEDGTNTIDTKRDNLIKSSYTDTYKSLGLDEAIKNTGLENINTRFVTSTLTCGSSVLTAQTTYIDVPGEIEPHVLKQHLIVQNTKTNIEKEVKTDSEYVIKHMPEEQKVLDAAIESWDCIKSKQNKYYWYLFYGCRSGEEYGFCERETVQKEWVRILNEDGSRVIKDSRSWEIKPSYIRIYKQLGIKNAVDQARPKSFPM